MTDESWRIQRNIFAEHRERLIEQVRRDRDFFWSHAKAAWDSGVMQTSEEFNRRGNEADATLRAVLGDEE